MQKKDNSIFNGKLKTIFNKYNLIAVYLFGSRVDGTVHEDSDYDFGILFKTLPVPSKIPEITMEIENELSQLLNSEVDIVVLNTAALEKRFFIINKGRLLFSGDDDKRTDFEDITIRDYLDYKPFLSLYRKEVLEEIREGGFYVKL